MNDSSFEFLEIWIGFHCNFNRTWAALWFIIMRVWCMRCIGFASWAYVFVYNKCVFTIIRVNVPVCSSFSQLRIFTKWTLIKSNVSKCSNENKHTNELQYDENEFYFFVSNLEPLSFLHFQYNTNTFSFYWVACSSSFYPNSVFSRFLDIDT